MPPSRPCNLDSLLLEQFQLQDRRIYIEAYAGGGDAGYTFRVRIGKKKYAYKMFKFDNPELNVNRFRGTHRRAFCDPFYIECRANGSLVQQGLNGKIFRPCYGWVDVPEYAEIEVATRFNIQPCLWERPDSAKGQRVRGILFEWVDGETLSSTSITGSIASRARTLLRELHRARILWGGLGRANFLIERPNSDQPILHLLDLSASITIPHVKFSMQQLKRMQQEELQLLEVGLALLSRNEGVSFAQLSDFGKDLLTKESQFIQHLWTEPQPTN